MPIFSIGHLVYKNISPLVRLPTDSYADKSEKIKPRGYGVFQILQIIEDTLTVYESSIPNATSIDRATLLARLTSHPARFKASETSLKDKTTFLEAGYYNDTRNSSPLYKGFCTDNQDISQKQKDSITETRPSFLPP